MKKEEIEITFQDGMLTISGERKQEHEATEGETFRKANAFSASSTGRCRCRQRSIRKKIKAVYKDGILSVELPKAAEAKAKQIEVKVS